MRRLDVLVAVTGELEAEVVRDDEEDVGLLLRGGSKNLAAEEQAGCQGSE